MPLFSSHHAPAPPNDLNAYERPNTEPIFMSLTSWQPKRRRSGFVDNGGEYLTSWYVGRITEDAVRNTYPPIAFFKVLDGAVIGCATRHWNAEWTTLPDSFTIHSWRHEPRFRWRTKGPSIRMGALLLHPHWTRETKITGWKRDRWFSMSTVMYIWPSRLLRSRSLWVSGGGSIFLPLNLSITRQDSKFPLSRLAQIPTITTIPILSLYKTVIFCKSVCCNYLDVMLHVTKIVRVCGIT